MTALGLGLLGLLVYTYAGYPLVVALWARVAPCRLRPQPDFEPTVSVCISVHNGEAYLREKLQSLQALDYPAHKLHMYESPATYPRAEDIGSRGINLPSGSSLKREQIAQVGEEISRFFPK